MHSPSRDPSGVTDIRFVDSAGAPLNGVDSGLDTLDGTSILLYTDTNNDNIVVGRAGSATGAIVFAAYIEETGSPLSGGKIWTVEYQPLKHPDATNPDDAVNLLNKVFIGAGQDAEFSLANAPSGQHLFLMFTTAGATADANGSGSPVPPSSPPARIRRPVASGANITSGDTINSSQGGGRTTFGTNNQMITEQEGMRFSASSRCQGGLHHSQPEPGPKRMLKRTSTSPSSSAPAPPPSTSCSRQSGTTAKLLLTAVNNADNIAGRRSASTAMQQTTPIDSTEKVAIINGSVTVIDVRGRHRQHRRHHLSTPTARC